MILSLALAGCLATVSPPAHEPDVAAFVEAARAATARYRDRAAAVADGYRLVGEDFPGMGEHWINIGLVFDGKYDVARPELLTYVVLDEAPRLIGVAYALPLLEGEQPPEEPVGRDAWHAHSRSVDEETLVPHHHGSDHAGQGSRLAMLHAWIWLDNPDGMFAADNWAIPFLRLGLSPPSHDAGAAGRALSLLSGTDAYLARAIPAAVAPAALDQSALLAVIARARRAVEVIAQGRSGATLSDAQLEALAAEWRGLWQAIDAALPPTAAERARSLSIR